METIAETYRIPTSLSIAVARLRAVMPSSMLYSENSVYQYGAGEIVAHFRFNEGPPLVQFLKGDYPDDEAHTFTVQAWRYLAWCGPWEVVISRELPWEMRWVYAGAKVTVDQRTRDMRAEGGSAAQQARAIWAVGQRLTSFQQSIPADLWAWNLRCRVVAVAPAEVYVLFEARGKLIEAWQRADAFIRSFWQQGARQEQGDSSIVPASCSREGTRYAGARQEQDDSSIVPFLQSTATPEEPQPGAPLDAWFDYYHRKREAGEKITLKEIADKAGYSAGYIRKVHLLYRQERGLGTAHRRSRHTGRERNKEGTKGTGFVVDSNS